MRRWTGLAIAAGCAAPVPSKPVVLQRLTGVVSYSSPAECFRSMVVVSPYPYYSSEPQVDLSFPYHGQTQTVATPKSLGDTIAREPLRSYELCVVPIVFDGVLELNPIEVGTGDALLWHDSDDYDVEQELVWSADRQNLLVELGRSVDDIPLSPFHGSGIVQVAAPAMLRRFPPDRTYKLVVHIDERRGGATIKLIEVDDMPNLEWTPVWTRVLHKE